MNARQSRAGDDLRARTRDDVASMAPPSIGPWTADHATIAALLEAIVILPKLESMPEIRL